jgi:protein-tyrosine phosphatase
MSFDPTGNPVNRIVALNGAINFRDIGGYQTGDGKLVTTKKIYRSGGLARLTLEDQDEITRLGIRVICDLRATSERRLKPSLLPTNAAIELWSRDYEMSIADLTTIMASPGMTAEACRAFMIDTYRMLAYEQADAYRELFLRIANGKLPLLFHCAAGKDRTGIGAALLLDALGVPRTAVIEDYLLTESFFDQNLENVLAFLGPYLVKSLPRHIWEPLIRAEAIYIETMFSELETRHGSVARFLREVLKLDDVILQRVRDRLLESDPAA